MTTFEDVEDALKAVDPTLTVTSIADFDGSGQEGFLWSGLIRGLRFDHAQQITDEAIDSAIHAHEVGNLDPDAPSIETRIAAVEARVTALESR